MPETSGASKKDIFNEPHWTKTHSHRVGLRDGDDRFPGLTHSGDDWRFAIEEEAEEKIQELKEKAARGELLTVRDFIAKQEDFEFKRPEVHPKNRRYVLHVTEDFIKEGQGWLINEKKRQHEEEKRQTQDTDKEEDSEPEPKKGKKEDESKPEYTPEQQALLRNLCEEAEHIRSMKQNDGKGRSPAWTEMTSTQIDELDQFSADNWIARPDTLIRITGKNPLNAEPDLSQLFDAGLITPNRLHYVRNHGSVPNLEWANHKLEISAGRSLALLMDDLTDQFESVNIPVLLACDGNRRKELNMIRRSKGFNFGPGAVSCAYWKGVLLRDVLLKADIMQLLDDYPSASLWVHFEGADELSEGRYSTCIPLEYAMDPNNDVLLAYEMNNSPLPADHGYPLRLIIPGYIGGRCVKWLANIWVTDRENDSYYHIYDNRVLPHFVTDPNSEFADILFHNPSTICNEQALNSIIVKPAQGESIRLVDVKTGQTYRIEGFAYSGGGQEVQRVEVSLDGGEKWLYCVRRYPEAPLRHGKKFWTWLFWHVDVDLSRMLEAQSITVRCFDVGKNTQPNTPSWNLTGMMNNCQYVVKPQVINAPDTNELLLMFRHPCEPGTGEGGWMEPSTEIQMEQAKRSAIAPQKQFTREEIESHSSERDCWIVINDKVYDATSVLSWHPGGITPILDHAGRVHSETTEAFESIHDDFAQKKLQECALGVVTDKVKEFMKHMAEQKAKQRAMSARRDTDVALSRHKWTLVRLVRKTKTSGDTSRYTFQLPPSSKTLGLETGQHVQLGFHFRDRLVFRPYTPVWPILSSQDRGTFDLVVKTYYPDPGQPGGTMSNILDCLREGEVVEVKGPSGQIRYQGNGEILVDNKKYSFDRVTLILGGSGITPGYQLVARILLTEEDRTEIRVIDANKTEDDILLRTELDQFAQDNSDQFSIIHVLSHPGKDWSGETGHVNERILRQYAFEPDDRSVALLCGPPAMIKKAVLPVLKDWGYHEDKNLFGF
ncbi:hypothetical protein SI65_06595 [Aspergillus cristatus]|uniref:Nitrate reductase [NADPH] n=1 Tax=Aspergillus cristatus TaxID=573508 RepID=A0A1E3BA37_ASPCR|nr:hypothetical protein SI65_06595 [Aspergillus cristatus]